MNSCPEFHCTVVTDFLLFIHVTTSVRPLLTSKKTHSWSNFSTYKLKVWITFATPPCNQTPYEQERQDAEPLTLKKLFRTCYKEEKKKKDFFFPLQLLFQTMKHHLTLCREAVHRVAFIWSGHLLSSKSLKRKIAMSRALNCFGENNWNWRDCGFQVSTSLSFIHKGNVGNVG